MKKRFVLSAFFMILISGMIFAQDVNLTSLAEKSGIMLYWDSLSRNGLLEKDGHRISFKVGDAFVLEDFKSLVELDAPRVEGGNLLVSSEFASHVEKFFGAEDVAPQYRVGVILIDPGHGGKDPAEPHPCRGILQSPQSVRTGVDAGGDPAGYGNIRKVRGVGDFGRDLVRPPAEREPAHADPVRGRICPAPYRRLLRAFQNLQPGGADGKLPYNL